MKVMIPPHHPSCKESDRSLVWECDQCGVVEPATLEELAALYKDMAVEAKRERDALFAACEAVEIAAMEDYAADQSVMAVAVERVRAVLQKVRS